MGNRSMGTPAPSRHRRHAWLPLAIASFALATAAPALAAPPANDLRANAEPLSGDTADVSGTNVDATKEPGEPNHAGDAGGHSVWWSWTAPGSGVVTVDACGSDFNTLLAVYRAATLKVAAKSNDAPGCGNGTQSRVQFTPNAGATYLIAVDGAGGATGDIDLGVHQAPNNDAFTKATTLSGPTPIIVSDDNRNATKQPGEPNHAGDPGGASVWYRWTPPSTGVVVLDACFPDFDTVLGVYTGGSIDNLTEVTSNDDDPNQCALDPNGSLVTFKAFRFTNYWIAVDGSAGAQGNFALVLSHFPDPKLSVSVSGNGAGSVTSDPAGINCGNGSTACSSGFSIFSTVTLTPQPTPGSVFGHWEGACSASPGACELFMTEAKNTEAVFKPAPSAQPDGQIRTRSSSDFLGDNVYNADGSSQTASGTDSAGGARGYIFKVENDATATDTISLQGCASTADFAVTYTLNGADVTAAVTAGTQQFTLQPAGRRSIRVTIDAAPGVANGFTSCALAATSANDAAKSDTVVAQLSIG